MNTKDKILKILEDSCEGETSGECIARQLGISRTAVWKCIKILKSEGYKIKAAPNRGYILSKDNDKLSENIIRSLIGSCGDVLIFDTIPSTNTYAKKLCADGIGDKSIIISSEQTAGRGRQGKSFYSPDSSGLYMSIILRMEKAMEDAAFLTLCAAVAVCRSIEKLCGEKAEIKWVNDVFYEGKKVCGILCEAISDFESRTTQVVIVGIGLNIKTKKFPEKIENIAGSLMCDVTRNVFAAQIAKELFCLYSDTDRKSLVREYRNNMMILNREISFFMNEKEYHGIAFDINENGNLLVKCGDEIIVLKSGEIHLGSENFSNPQ